MLLSTIVGPPSPSDLFARRQELVAARRASGLGAPTAADVARLVGSTAIQRVEWDSQVTPAWSYDPSAPSRPGGDWLMRAIRPVVRIVPVAGPPIEYAPYGRPDSTTKTLVAAGVAAATVVGGVALAGLVARAFGRPRQANPRRRRRR